MATNVTATRPTMSSGPEGHPKARSGRDLLRRQSVLFGSVVLAGVAVIAWWLASTATFVVPNPVETVRSLVTSLNEPGYLVDVRSTALAAVLALGSAIVVGLLVGTALGLLPAVSRGFEPLLVAANGVPKLVLYPVLLLFLSMGTTSKVVLGAIIGVFPVLMNVAAGIREMPAIYSRLARSLELSRWQTFRHVIAPAIRRPAMTGIRLAVSLSTVGVVLAEIFATQYGLGRTILASYTSAQYPRMLGTVLLLVGVAFIATMLLWRLERRMR